MSTTHNLSKHKLYFVFQSMKSRCYNKNNHAYNRYGGRGIKICNEWKDNFLNFYLWAIDNGYTQGLSIDRLDNNKDYAPNNCRWATIIEQNNNQRSNKYITFNGKTQTVTNWAKYLNRDYSTIIYHVNKIEKWIYNSFKSTSTL